MARRCGMREWLHRFGEWYRGMWQDGDGKFVFMLTSHVVIGTGFVLPIIVGLIITWWRAVFWLFGIEPE